MIAAGNSRIGWTDLPVHVRAAVEEMLGGHVVTAVSQPGGFSPGTADRVITVDGRRAFVKAVSAALNEDSPTLHRREAVAAAALPRDAPVPAFVGAFDDGEWVALVMADVDGRHPRTPWQPDELNSALAATRRLADILTPSPMPDLPRPSVASRAGWHALRADPPEHIDAWFATRLDDLCAWEDFGAARLSGNTLVHGDLRADNMLVRPDGSFVFVDWPWASNGPVWFDPLFLLVNVACFGGPDPEALVAAACPAAEPDEITATLAVFTGFLIDAARRPAPPGLPGLRGFQSDQARALSDWLRTRLAPIPRATGR